MILLPIQIEHSNPKRYYGKVCQLHPELLGERTISSRGCTGCNKDKMKERRNGGQYYRSVERKAYRKHYEKNKTTILAKVRKRRTGCDSRLFGNLLAVQAGICPICHGSLGKHPHADHNHDTGRPRGLLCGNCNRLEGMIRRTGASPQVVAARLSAYIKFPPAEPYLKSREH